MTSVSAAFVPWRQSCRGTLLTGTWRWALFIAAPSVARWRHKHRFPFARGGTVLPACRTGRVLRLQLPRRLHPYALSLQAHLCHVRPGPPKPLMPCCERREGPWQASRRRCASTALIAIYVIMLLRCGIRLWGLHSRLSHSI